MSKQFINSNGAAVVADFVTATDQCVVWDPHIEYGCTKILIIEPILNLQLEDK